MEPRIATLLGSSSSSSSPSRTPGPTDARTLLPPPAVALRRPHPVEQNVRQNNKRQEPSVPIAGVLNDDSSPPTNAHGVPAASTTSLPPFSGRLVDLLLDPSQQHSFKRRRLDEQGMATPALTSDNKLKLPEPTQQLSKKAPKRPRIPPLLQGLHHPPPLPERVFPPITGEAGSFGRDIGDRVAVRSPVRLDYIQEESRDELGRNNVLGLQDRRGVKVIKKSTVASTSVKENRSRAEKDGAPANTLVTKQSRKRNKWSDKEMPRFYFHSAYSRGSQGQIPRVLSRRWT
jgi:hypothetical protein